MPSRDGGDREADMVRYAGEWDRPAHRGSTHGTPVGTGSRQELPCLPGQGASALVVESVRMMIDSIRTFSSSVPMSFSRYSGSRRPGDSHFGHAFRVDEADQMPISSSSATGGESKLIVVLSEQLLGHAAGSVGSCIGCRRDAQVTNRTLNPIDEGTHRAKVPGEPTTRQWVLCCGHAERHFESMALIP